MLLFFLLPFSTSKWAARDYFWNSRGFGVILVSMFGFIASSPSFGGHGEIAPNFAKKCDSALIWSIVVIKWLNM